jgi:hypothetical protein
VENSLWKRQWTRRKTRLHDDVYDDDDDDDDVGGGESEAFFNVKIHPFRFRGVGLHCLTQGANTFQNLRATSKL